MTGITPMRVQLSNRGDAIRAVYNSVAQMHAIAVGQTIELDIALGQVVKFEEAMRKGDTLHVKRLEETQRSKRVRILPPGETVQPEDKTLQVALKSRGERTPKSDAALAILERAPELEYHELLEQAVMVLGQEHFGEPRPNRPRIIEDLRRAAQ